MALVWLFGVTSSVPSAIVYRVVNIDMNEDDEGEQGGCPSPVFTKPFCAPYFPMMWDGKIDTGYLYRLYLVVLQYLLPLGAIGYAYARILARIWRLKMPGATVDSKDFTRHKNKRKVGGIFSRFYR